MQLYLIFTLILCKILCRTWMVGKCSFSNFENTAPTLVFKFFEWDGLNHIIFLLSFLALFFSSYCAPSAKPLSFSALLQILHDLLNISSVDHVSKNQEEKKCKNKITWFKQLYQKNVLKIIGQAFPRQPCSTHNFKQKKVKTSCGCLKNINSVIFTNNKNILNRGTQLFKCNCWNKESCTLNGECLTPHVVYRATVNEDMKT